MKPERMRRLRKSFYFHTYWVHEMQKRDMTHGRRNQLGDRTMESEGITKSGYGPCCQRYPDPSQCSKENRI